MGPVVPKQPHTCRQPATYSGRCEPQADHDRRQSVPKREGVTAALPARGTWFRRERERSAITTAPFKSQEKSALSSSGRSTQAREGPVQAARAEPQAAGWAFRGRKLFGIINLGKDQVAVPTGAGKWLPISRRWPALPFATAPFCTLRPARAPALQRSARRCTWRGTFRTSESITSLARAARERRDRCRCAMRPGPCRSVTLRAPQRTQGKAALLMGGRIGAFAEQPQEPGVIGAAERHYSDLVPAQPEQAVSNFVGRVPAESKHRELAFCAGVQLLFSMI